ncbi:MAG: hypothetical protein K2K83_03505 [Rikenella sp.]|nr:hypothetical protein [Rikenella sp.]
MLSQNERNSPFRRAGDGFFPKKPCFPARWRKSCSKAQAAFERFPYPASARGISRRKTFSDRAPAGLSGKTIRFSTQSGSLGEARFKTVFDWPRAGRAPRARGGQEAAVVKSSAQKPNKPRRAGNAAHRLGQTAQKNKAPKKIDTLKKYKKFTPRCLEVSKIALPLHRYTSYTMALSSIG